MSQQQPGDATPTSAQIAGSKTTTRHSSLRLHPSVNLSLTPSLNGAHASIVQGLQD
jgi:hypothetical protein